MTEGRDKQGSTDSQRASKGLTYPSSIEVFKWFSTLLWLCFSSNPQQGSWGTNLRRDLADHEQYVLLRSSQTHYENHMILLAINFISFSLSLSLYISRESLVSSSVKNASAIASLVFCVPDTMPLFIPRVSSQHVTGSWSSVDDFLQCQFPVYLNPTHVIVLSHAGNQLGASLGPTTTLERDMI